VFHVYPASELDDRLRLFEAHYSVSSTSHEGEGIGVQNPRDAIPDNLPFLALLKRSIVASRGIG
jgi:hypothetical protein